MGCIDKSVMITPAISSPSRELLGSVVILEEKEKPLTHEGHMP